MHLKHDLTNAVRHACIALCPCADPWVLECNNWVPVDMNLEGQVEDRTVFYSMRGTPHCENVFRCTNNVASVNAGEDLKSALLAQRVFRWNVDRSVALKLPGFEKIEHYNLRVYSEINHMRASHNLPRVKPDVPHMDSMKSRDYGEHQLYAWNSEAGWKVFQDLGLDMKTKLGDSIPAVDMTRAHKDFMVQAASNLKTLHTQAIEQLTKNMFQSLPVWRTHTDFWNQYVPHASQYPVPVPAKEQWAPKQLLDQLHRESEGKQRSGTTLAPTHTTPIAPSTVPRHPDQQLRTYPVTPWTVQHTNRQGTSSDIQPTHQSGLIMDDDEAAGQRMPRDDQAAGSHHPLSPSNKQASLAAAVKFACQAASKMISRPGAASRDFSQQGRITTNMQPSGSNAQPSRITTNMQPSGSSAQPSRTTTNVQLGGSSAQRRTSTFVGGNVQHVNLLDDGDQENAAPVHAGSFGAVTNKFQVSGQRKTKRFQRRNTRGLPRYLPNTHTPIQTLAEVKLFFQLREQYTRGKKVDFAGMATAWNVAFVLQAMQRASVEPQDVINSKNQKFLKQFHLKVDSLVRQRHSSHFTQAMITTAEHSMQSPSMSGSKAGAMETSFIHAGRPLQETSGNILPLATHEPQMLTSPIPGVPGTMTAANAPMTIPDAGAMQTDQETNLMQPANKRPRVNASFFNAVHGQRAALPAHAQQLTTPPNVAGQGSAGRQQGASTGLVKGPQYCTVCAYKDKLRVLRKDHKCPWKDRPDWEHVKAQVSSFFASHKMGVQEYLQKYGNVHKIA